jgi:hypothetical protein
MAALVPTYTSTRRRNPEGYGQRHILLPVVAFRYQPVIENDPVKIYYSFFITKPYSETANPAAKLLRCINLSRSAQCWLLL